MPIHRCTCPDKVKDDEKCFYCISKSYVFTSPSELEAHLNNFNKMKQERVSRLCSMAANIAAGWLSVEDTESSLGGTIRASVLAAVMIEERVVQKVVEDSVDDIFD